MSYIAYTECTSVTILCRQTFPELLLPVVACDLDLEHTVGDDVGGESTEALSTTAPNPNQHRVASGLPDHSDNTTHWRGGRKVSKHILQTIFCLCSMYIALCISSCYKLNTILCNGSGCL